jgi:hypothetical protein
MPVPLAESPLADAVANGRLDAAYGLIQEGVDVNGARGRRHDGGAFV